ncbi:MULTISPECIES: NUDIX hydrolase [Pantoea]|uniref:NUDIX hydrolase n=1 Tax=Pantoea TaxID=53335 RepID=UPI0005422965|nr:MULTISPECIES: NUDIX hydrolase [Pantoea]KHE03269.1 NUDIX hydrolase [Pantoea stewartii]KHN62032.1 NUDIX hydrolase [Pantoea stewartii]MEB6534480.1 NUDIX hydrolase [Pantoea stewartii]UYK98948.1 NUDIX hydrolase [Pantoea stewartii]WRH21452.1 NUDIX domain-containing protein [Pantoea sp. JZ29]
MSDHLATHFPVSIKGIVFLKNKVLLLKNERDEWELPGGKLEAGETPEACVIREIAEETQINSSIERIVDTWVYHVNEVDVLIVTYLMHISNPEVGIMKVSHEHKEIGLFSTSQIGELNMPEGYKNSLKKVIIY